MAVHFKTSFLELLGSTIVSDRFVLFSPGLEFIGNEAINLNVSIKCSPDILIVNLGFLEMSSKVVFKSQK